MRKKLELVHINRNARILKRIFCRTRRKFADVLCVLQEFSTQLCEKYVKRRALSVNVKHALASIVFILAMFALIGAECDSNILFFVIFKLSALGIMLAAYFLGQLGDDEKNIEKHEDDTNLEAS